MDSLRTKHLNRTDLNKLQRGYYEDLLSIDRTNPDLWQLYGSKPTEWHKMRNSAASRLTGDFQRWELVPSKETVFKAALVSVNRWGMRDREYNQVRPPNTFRIALLGSSHVMGEGVANDETFESLVEERLNRNGPGTPSKRYEILNFAVSGYSPIERLMVLENKVFPFQPNAVFYVAHAAELFNIISIMAQNLRNGVDLPYPEIWAIIGRAGLKHNARPFVIQRRLKRKHKMEILDWIYHRVVALCREHQARPVWVYLPTPENAGRTSHNFTPYRSLAAEAGFEILDLSGVYDGPDPSTLQIAEWDSHPNHLAHQLIADKLYRELQKRATTLLASAQ